MQLWTTWVDFPDGLLAFLAAAPMLGPGLAIVALTLILRALLLPVSWSCAYGTCIRQERLVRLKPELERIRRQYGNQPGRMVEETTNLYRRRGMRIVETRPILGAFLQMPALQTLAVHGVVNRRTRTGKVRI